MCACVCLLSGLKVGVECVKLLSAYFSYIVLNLNSAKHAMFKASRSFLTLLYLECNVKKILCGINKNKQL